MRLALVLADGGERAIAWERGVLAGLELSRTRPGVLHVAGGAEEEIAALERGGSEVLLVQAGVEDQAAMGLEFMSAERAGEAFAAGQARGATGS